MRQDILVRVLPFAIFIVFLAIEHQLAGTHAASFDSRWLYVAKSAVVGGMLVLFSRAYAELRFTAHTLPWVFIAAPLIGVIVFTLWINLDHGLLNIGSGPGFDPRDQSGAIDWQLAIPRLAGAAIVVPVMEELFWRSFLMRWIDRHDFLNLVPKAASARAILLSSFVFGLEHSLWFAGMVAGLAYALLYRVSGTLWTPIMAHAVTNAALGIWVLQTGNWQFW